MEGEGEREWDTEMSYSGKERKKEKQGRKMMKWEERMKREKLGSDVLRLRWTDNGWGTVD